MKLIILKTTINFIKNSLITKTKYYLIFTIHTNIFFQHGIRYLASLHIIK